MFLVIPIFIPHQGCPHHCLFCNQTKISGSKELATDQLDIATIIDLWLTRSPGKKKVQVAFFGGSFTCLPTAGQIAMLASVQPYIDAGMVDCIRLSTRPDCITPQQCDLLREYRVGVVELGVQSLNDQVLVVNRRGHRAQESRSAFAQLKAAGMEVGLQLMPGLPEESRRSFLRGIDEVVALKPGFCPPLSGSGGKRFRPGTAIPGKQLSTAQPDRGRCPHRQGLQQAPGGRHWRNTNGIAALRITDQQLHRRAIPSKLW